MQIIRASEVAEYVYCARAWWLRRVAGLEPTGWERRKQGTIQHARHGYAVQISSVLLVIAGIFFLIALGLLMNTM